MLKCATGVASTLVACRQSFNLPHMAQVDNEHSKIVLKQGGYDARPRPLVPFPGHTRDLQFLAPASEDRRLRLLVTLAQALRHAGIAGAVCGHGSVTRIGVVPEEDLPRLYQPHDILVPRQDLPGALAASTKWAARGPRRRLTVLRGGLEVQVGWLPTKDFPTLIPSDMDFRIACPRCAYVSIFGYDRRRTAGGGEVLVLTDNVPPCEWPAGLLLPATAVPLAHLTWRASRQPRAATLPWPPDVHGMFAHKEEALLGNSTSTCWPWLRVLPFPPRGASAITRPAPEFHLRPEASMPFAAMYERRKASEDPRLRQYVDKIALKARLQAEGLPILEVLLASRTSPRAAAAAISSTSRYVAKVTHRDGSHGVFVMDDGMELLTRRRLTPAQVLEGLEEAWVAAAPCGDGPGLAACRWRGWADENLPPGVIVEALALPWDGRRSALPDEVQCFVVWGRTVFCGVIAPGGNWGGFMARDGTPLFGWPCAGKSAREVRLPAYPAAMHAELIELAEQTAMRFGADFLRVDLFPNGGMPVVNEVAMVPGWLGKANIDWRVPEAWMVEELGRRWMAGYGQLGD